MYLEQKTVPYFTDVLKLEDSKHFLWSFEELFKGEVKQKSDGALFL